MVKKNTVITFKADAEMLDALERVPNKSEFIRAAVLAALDENCPFCGGTGILNPHQRKHWASFLKEHTLVRCKECNGITINCHHHETEENHDESREKE